jgi:hypothetical protein
MMTELLPGLDWEVCARARLARDPAFDGVFFHGSSNYPDLLSSGLSGTTSPFGECCVLWFGSRRGTSRVPAMPSLPTRDGTGKPGVERNCHDGGARYASY